MKRSTKVKIIIFFIVFFLCFVDLRPLFRPKTPPKPVTITTPLVDTTRKSYNKGTCYDMEKELCYLIVHIDDNESNWDEEEKTEFAENKLIPSLAYLSEKAAEYNVTLCTDYKNSDENVTYKGIIEADVVENGSQEDIPHQAAVSMGYSTPEEMDSSLKKEMNVKQIAYLFIVDKAGRSYKYSYVTKDSKTMEFCVFFDDSIKFDGNVCCSTISHEVLHLFGAEDYYDPYGKLPERAKLAEELYPNDIMLAYLNNVNDAKIGAYTAYSVGWTDTLPAECDVDCWWE